MEKDAKKDWAFFMFYHLAHQRDTQSNLTLENQDKQRARGSTVGARLRGKHHRVNCNQLGEWKVLEVCVANSTLWDWE